MSSSSSITTTTVNGTTRLTGLSSGLDVDGIVEQLLTAEKTKKLNKLQQKLQTAQWAQEAYQSVITDLQDFTSKYLDVTSSSSIIKASNFLKYSSTSSSSAVSVTASSTASAGSHTVSVSQLATKATVSSGSSVSKEVQGSSAVDWSTADLSNQSFVITLDGTSYTVSLDHVTSLDTLQSAVDTAVGSGKVSVSTNSSGNLELASADSGVQAISVSAVSSNKGLTNLGFGTDAVYSNRLSTSDTLETIAGQLKGTLTFSDAGEVELTINGTAMTFDKSETLSDMISAVNKASLGVTMSYNSLTGQLVLTANETGAGNKVSVSDTVKDSSETNQSNFASLLLGTMTAGKDCKMTIDGQAITRSSNSITIDGVTYTANQVTTTTTTDSSGVTTTTDSPSTVTVSRDTEGVYDLIKSFVDDYNTLLSTLNSLVNEDKDSDYPPLTDDQKAEMTEDEISKWETKAKVGLLESDSTLKSIISNMRDALMDSVAGQTTTLASIGITSGSYDEKGTLYIDQDTLESAIASDPEGVMNLFTQQATSKSSSGKSLAGTTVVRTLNSKDLSTRYKEEGIGYRLYDIMAKNISTIRDSSGNKGILLEKAGTDGDASETDNYYTSLIEKYQNAIDEEEDRLDDFQEKLYDKYSLLETYINKMTSQLSALSSLTSS